MTTKTFDQVLEEVNKEYNWPINPKAAARVGAEAYRRFIQPELDRKDTLIREFLDKITALDKDTW